MTGQWLKTGISALSLSLTAMAQAQDLPGEGIPVQPVKSGIEEETFQTLLVSRALEELGYDVSEIKITSYPKGHETVANEPGAFMADHWDPLHTDFYEEAGGDDKIYRKGVYSPGALQGYLIDRATAEEYNITNIRQLQNPEIARLFDNDDDGKADLTGCVDSWGCGQVIEHHLDAYDLRDTVTHNQGRYNTIIGQTIQRFQDGKPVLYYTWTPYWVSGVMVPGKDVVWLEVPFSSLPGERRNVDTSLPDGTDYGFQANDQRIIANQEFADDHPAAARLFEVMVLSANDISSQNLAMQNGEDSFEDIQRHTDEWIEAHRDTFNGWLEEAREAAR